MHLKALRLALLLPAGRLALGDDVADLITASARRLVARVQTQPAGN